MRKVSADEWADFCSDYKNYSRERVLQGNSVMEQVAPDGVPIAMVVYGEVKSYHIRPEAVRPEYRLFGTRDWGAESRQTVKCSSILHDDLIAAGEVNGRWVVEVKGEQPGTLVCEAAVNTGDMATDQFMSLTILRSGRIYWDEGVFTPRAK